jgi:hypothetical protein
MSFIATIFFSHPGRKQGVTISASPKTGHGWTFVTGAFIPPPLSLPPSPPTPPTFFPLPSPSSFNLHKTNTVLSVMVTQHFFSSDNKLWCLAETRFISEQTDDIPSWRKIALYVNKEPVDRKKRCFCVPAMISRHGYCSYCGATDEIQIVW